MPALKAGEVREHLATYVRNGIDAETFFAALNQALPRLYGLGAWRDLTEDMELSVVGDQIGLPHDFESVVFHLKDDVPGDIFTYWYDWKLLGQLPDGQTEPCYGLVDAGLQATQCPLDGTSEYMVIVTPSDGASSFGAVPGTIKVQARVSSGRRVTEAFTPTNDAAQKANIQDDTATGGVLVLGATDPRTESTVAFATRLADDGVYGKALYQFLTYDSALVADTPIYVTYDALALSGPAWVIDFSGAGYGGPSTYAALALAQDYPFESITPWFEGDSGDEVPEIRVLAAARAGTPLLGGEHETAIGVLHIDQLSAKVVDHPLDVWALNMTDGKSHLNLGTVQGSGAMRYRRYRVGGDNTAAVVKVLAKRRVPVITHEEQDIHLSNLVVLKHALLAVNAEDNADMERAEFHWGKCESALEEEMDQYRGSARPSLKLNIWGVGRPIHNAT